MFLARYNFHAAAPPPLVAVTLGVLAGWSDPSVVQVDEDGNDAWLGGGGAANDVYDAMDKPRDHVAVIRLLIHAGAEVNTPTKQMCLHPAVAVSGSTPLHLAAASITVPGGAYYLQPSLVLVLLRSGAAVRPNSQGQGPAEVLISALQARGARADFLRAAIVAVPRNHTAASSPMLFLADIFMASGVHASAAEKEGGGEGGKGGVPERKKPRASHILSCKPQHFAHINAR